MLVKLFLWFIFYSVFGWLWEVCLYLAEDKKFVNRGFLNGPYCPIYGAGAILDILLLGKIENSGLLFVLGVLVTGVLEYLTSYIMEKIFHARWWDYSERKFNINGRVCLAGMIAFGSLSVILIKLVHPPIVRLTDKLSITALYLSAGTIGALFIFDILYTLLKIKGFDKKLAEINGRIHENIHSGFSKTHTATMLERVKQNFEDIDLREKIDEVVANFKKNRLNRQEIRLIRAFPKLKSTKYSDIIEKLRNRK